MNKDFERDGFLEVPGIIMDPENTYSPVPHHPNGERVSGSIQFKSNGEYTYTPEETQVPGSCSRYNNPKYKSLHYIVKKAVENILGMDLHPSYFYERYYYVGQKLERHSDRPACEISVTLQISTNSEKPWPIWFEKPDGSEESVEMNTGDGVIYKGCEREHWRDPLKSRYNKYQKKWKEIRNKEDDTYHHQIFLHYVNAQGPYVHHAFDR
tara:strand:+ start:494 stop:1123 length:630 start_codon:yes stop_codon:yes gene_type:complete